MPLRVSDHGPTLFLRRAAYERSGLTRTQLDDRLGLTADEFRVEGDLVAVGPIPGDDSWSALIEELESLGLTYFEDFFELSGNWPDWLQLFAGGG